MCKLISTVGDDKYMVFAFDGPRECAKEIHGYVL